VGQDGFLLVLIIVCCSSKGMGAAGVGVDSGGRNGRATAVGCTRAWATTRRTGCRPSSEYGHHPATGPSTTAATVATAPVATAATTAAGIASKQCGEW